MRGPEIISWTDPGKNRKFSNVHYRKKRSRSGIFCTFLGSVVFFDAFYHKYHFLMKNMLKKLNFIAIFLILTNFAAFLDHTKENADISKNDVYF